MTNNHEKPTCTKPMLGVVLNEDCLTTMAKEEKQKLIDSFKTRATEAIQKQREHLKNVERLKKEFNDKVEQSMKDFSTTVAGLFKDLSKIENIEKDYYDILIGKTSSDENEEKNEDIPPAQL